MRLFKTAHHTTTGTVVNTDHHYIACLVSLLMLSCSLWWTAIQTEFFEIVRQQLIRRSPNRSFPALPAHLDGKLPVKC